MGQTLTTSEDAEVLEYLEKKPELHEREAIEIKEMFDSLKPVDNAVSLDDLETVYKNSTEIETLRERFGSKRWVCFDEFFDVVSSMILERRQNLNDIECEASGRNVSCFYCPFPSDSSKRGISRTRD